MTVAESFLKIAVANWIWKRGFDPLRRESGVASIALLLLLFDEAITAGTDDDETEEDLFVFLVLLLLTDGEVEREDFVVFTFVVVFLAFFG